MNRGAKVYAFQGYWTSAERKKVPRPLYGPRCKERWCYSHNWRNRSLASSSTIQSFAPSASSV